ncbi:hypothetical protein ACUODF_57350, partial [Escherichia coli]
LIVPEYPAMLQSMGRYLALGLIALPIAWLGRVRLRQLARRDWLTALMLTMIGKDRNDHRQGADNHRGNRRASTLN